MFHPSVISDVTVTPPRTEPFGAPAVVSYISLRENKGNQIKEKSHGIIIRSPNKMNFLFVAWPYWPYFMGMMPMKRFILLEAFSTKYIPDYAFNNIILVRCVSRYLRYRDSIVTAIPKV